MSELDKQVTFSGDGGQDVSQDVSQEAAGAEQEQSTEQQYLTRQEAQRLFQEQKDEFLRTAQSLTDKASSRLDKKFRDEIKLVNGAIELQKKAGIPITPEQERAMRQMAYDSAIDQVAKEEDDPAVTVQKPKLPEDPQQVMQMAGAAVVDGMLQDIYKTAGVTLMDNDPEADLIDKSNPMAFLKSVEAAVEKKKQRVQTAPETRITSLGKGTQTNLEAQYLEEKSKIQGDVPALIALKQKYRSKGLQV